MSRVPTNLTHDLTCLVKASNLSCSQVIWRRWPITAALCTQIKTWLRAIHKNGCLLSRLSCCMQHVHPSPSCEPIARSKMQSWPWGRTDIGRHLNTAHGHFAPPKQLHRSCQSQGLAGRWGCWARKCCMQPRSLFPVSSEGCVPGRETNLAGPGSTQEGQKIQPGAKARLNLAVPQASELPC